MSSHHSTVPVLLIYFQRRLVSQMGRHWMPLPISLSFLTQHTSSHAPTLWFCHTWCSWSLGSDPLVLCRIFVFLPFVEPFTPFASNFFRLKESFLATEVYLIFDTLFTGNAFPLLALDLRICVALPPATLYTALASH